MEALDDIVARFWRDGYAVIRGAFDQSEVAAWRKQALQERSEGELLSRPHLREVVCDKRLIDVARAILGDQPVYFGDSTVSIGTAQGSGFHKDNTDRYDGAAPDWSVSRYPTLRFGIYTQSHGKLPNGLDLKIGSHMMPGRLEGESASPAVDPGDLIVWNGRTSHSANSPRLKIVGARVNPNGFAWRVIRKLASEKLVYATHPQERVAFFLTYAARHALLDRHIAYLKTRAYAVEMMQASEWDEDARAAARSAGLALLKPDPSDASGHNIDYAPVPYDLPAPAQTIV